MHGPQHPSSNRSDYGSHGQGSSPPPVRPRSRPPLSEAAIAAIAEQIAQAMPLPAPEDQTTWILARAAELPADDEARVIRVLTDPSRAPQSGPRP